MTDARIVALTGTNYFTVKKLLGVDDTTGSYLLYCPISYESQDENWLLDNIQSKDNVLTLLVHLGYLVYDAASKSV